MTGVPGGDVTLQAAITETLAAHEWVTYSPRQKSRCACGWRWKLGSPHAAHQAERVLAVLADQLPHTPADQLATLLGGTVERYGTGEPRARIVTRWVPDSPPAAPEPRQDT